MPRKKLTVFFNYVTVIVTNGKICTIKLLLKAAILDLTSFLIDLFIYIIKEKTKTKN